MQQPNGTVWLLALAALCGGCGQDTEARIRSVYDLKADPTTENVARIRQLLDDDDRDVRATALNALVTLKTPDAEQLALAGLSDEDGFVRATAAKLVADVADAASSPPLVGRLREDEDPVVRQRAAEALARLGGAAAIEGLALGLNDPINRVRLASVRGIRTLDPGSHGPALSRLLLEDPEWEIRVQAAKALGAAGNPDYLPVLEAALGDPNEFVRSAVANAVRAYETADPPIVGDGRN